MKKPLLTLLTIILFALTVNAQSYTGYMNLGKSFYKKQQYLTALERFDLAYEFAKSNSEKDQAKNWKNKSRKKIRQQQAALKKAIFNVKQERQKAQKIIDAIYFYDEKFALVYKSEWGSGSYGFIDKQGNVKIDYQYKEALPFDEKTGLAKVKYSKNYYIIDTTGMKYLLAESISELTEKTKALDLSQKKLTEIPKEVFNYPQLKILLLNQNNITVLPPEIGKLSNLTTLILSNNQLTTLPPEIGELTNLKTFQLENNELEEIPSEITNLTNLKEFDIGSNQLSSLQTEFFKLTNLQKLNLSGNKLTTLPHEIGQLINLKTLNISNNDFSSLPSEIGKLTNLNKLRIIECRLETLPTEIGTLKELTELYLQQNVLTSVPKEIGGLKNLKVLCLFENKLQGIPVELGKLNNIETLDFRANKNFDFKSVCNAFAKYSRKIIIEGYWNERASNENPETLLIKMLDIGSLPPEISKLTSLTELYLMDNRLTSLSPEIRNVKSLKILDLSYNLLNSLPPEISRLTTLKTLNLSDNQFSQSEKDKIKKLLPNCKITF